jgi:alkanesulfonate monooxygenase SsuD/methylene tetrahydromethanopterin reductase-like flavin-dependent oxidoreductase (luciferase family)
MFTFRFDMRAPATGAPPADLYAAALEMTEWAESRGLLMALLCEHHGSPDGYLPSPLALASAMAARTKTLPITIAIFQLPLYNPVRLAEEMNVIDLISRGRVSYVGGIGYLPAEYEASGIDFHKRGKIADAHLELLLQALKGEPFEYEGRRIHITPGPFTPGGARIAWGGGSAAAAKRAGRLGLDLFAQSEDPELRVVYEAACAANGHPVGNCILPKRDGTVVAFVAEDVDQAWEELGPYLMHDVLTYGEWNEGREASGISRVRDAAALRAENTTHRILSVAEAIEQVRTGVPLMLHPLIGGMPPDLAWRYLKTVTEKVMPALAM